MNSIPKNRNTLLDFLKGTAVIFMIQVHIIELFASKEFSNSTAGHVSLFLGGAPVAPLFLLVFGYLIASSDKTDKELLHRGLKIFLIGMLLNCLLNLNLIISVTNKIIKVDLWPYIFGVDVLHLAGMSLIIIALLRKIIFKNIISTITLISVILILSQLLSSTVIESQLLKYLSSFIWGSSSWSYFPILPWLVYPLTGIAVNQFKEKNSFAFFDSVKMKVGIGLAFLVFMYLTIPFAFSISSTLSIYYHHNFLFFIWVVTFLGFYSFLLNEVNKLNKELAIGKYIRWLGKNVTIIYIIQWILIGNIATEIYRTIDSPIKLGAYFLSILVATSIITFLILKLRDNKSNSQS